MSTPKGYSTQEKEDRLKAEFTTVEPVRELQHGLSVMAHQYVRVVASSVVEASSTDTTINATAHVAKKGDVIRITSGALLGQEVKVWSTTANTIVLGEQLPSVPATGVTFDILRHKYPLVDSNGNLLASLISSGSIQFVKNGSNTNVIEDTVTPANNVPLPVKITSATGPINITAGDLNVQISHAGANYDSTRIGDGTDLLSITGAGQAEVAVTAALPAGGNTIGNVGAAQSGTWNINNVSGTVSLPTGAATEATLSSVNGKLNTLGQKTSANSVPVTISSDQSAISTSASQSGTWNITNVSGTVSLPTGAATEATLSSVNGKLGSLGQKTSAGSAPVVLASDQSALPASQSGTWNINNVSGAISLPTGASTEATLSGLNAKFSALGQKTSANSTPVVLSSDQSAIPATQSGTWNINNVSGTVSLPTGAATETTLSGINGKLNSLGQKTSANSVPVTISSDQSAIPASQSGTWNITNVSGTVSLPTGAATETTLSGINGKLGSLGQKTSAGSAPVVLASDQSAIPSSQSGTWNINNVSGTVSLPTGASTETTLSGLSAKFGSLGQKTSAGSAPIVIASDQSAVPVSGTVTANQGTANATPWNSNISQYGGTSTTLGQKTASASIPVALASDTTIPATIGRSVVTTVRNDYTGTSVTSGAWVQLVASLGATVHELEIFDSSGQTLEIGTGGAGSETRLLLVFPGGNGRVPVKVNSGTRIAIRAVSATASSGEIDINFYGA